MINMDKKVNVYLNSHLKCWSVRQGGRVIKHTDHIVLRNCELVVSLAGNARVRKTRKKNVHAFVRGFVSSAKEAREKISPSENPKYKEVFYNPYNHTSFVDGLGNAISYAEWVDLDLRYDVHPVLAFGDIH